MKKVSSPEHIAAAVKQRILTADRCPRASTVYMVVDSLDDGEGGWQIKFAGDLPPDQRDEVILAASEVAAEHRLAWPPLGTTWL